MKKDSGDYIDIDAHIWYNFIRIYKKLLANGDYYENYSCN